jgi:hypothetical protein
MRKLTKLALIASLTLGLPLAAAGGEDAGTNKLKAPDVVEFLLADGSKVTGKVSIKEIKVETAYGQLTVPLTDAVRLRVGRGSDKTAAAKISALIKKLGSTDFKERQQATEKLKDYGEEALELLKKATESTDAEIKSRAEKIIEEIEKQPYAGDEDEDEEGEGPLMGDQDELVTKRFTAMGKVLIEKFEVETRYGKLTVPRDQVVKATFTRPDGVVKNIRLQGHQTNRSPLRTKVKLKRGQKVKITAKGSIRYNNYNREVTPNGDSRYFGTYNGCQGMCLVYRIGNSGRWTMLGTKKVLKAPVTGELMLSVNYSSNPGPSTGSWKIKVEVTPK